MNTLSDGTKIPLKTAAPVVVSILVTALWITSKINGLEANNRVSEVRQEHIQESVTAIKFDLQEVRLLVQNDRWTESDMMRWTREFAKLNPNLAIPEVQ